MKEIEFGIHLKISFSVFSDCTIFVLCEVQKSIKGISSCTTGQEEEENIYKIVNGATSVHFGQCALLCV